MSWMKPILERVGENFNHHTNPIRNATFERQFLYVFSASRYSFNAHNKERYTQAYCIFIIIERNSLLTWRYSKVRLLKVISSKLWNIVSVVFSTSHYVWNHETNRKCDGQAVTHFLDRYELMFDYFGKSSEMKNLWIQYCNLCTFSRNS